MALVAYVYCIPRGVLANPDTRIALTSAIVDHHALRIDPYAGSLMDRALYHGHYYTDKAPGMSLLAVPAYAALHLVLPSATLNTKHTLPAYFFTRYLLTSLVLGIPAAVFVGLLWRFLLPMLGRRRGAVLALGYGLGTVAWAYSGVLFSHIMSAMSLFGAFMLLYPVSTGRAPFATRRWAAAGGLCGLAALCEYPAALVGLLLALFAAYTAYTARDAGPRRLPGLGAFVGAGLLALLPLALYNTAVYGSPLVIGYVHEAGEARFLAGMSRGFEGVGAPDPVALWGITFSPYRGLFALSPFLLLALPGAAAMWRRRRQRPAAVLCVLVVVAMLLFNGGYYFWDGGATIGPRFAAAVVPFLVFLAAFAPRRAPWARVTPVLIALSIALVALCCLTSITGFSSGQPNPFAAFVLPRLLHGSIPDNWGGRLGLPGTASLLPLAAIEAALSWGLWRSLCPKRRTMTRGLSGVPGDLDQSLDRDRVGLA